MTTRKPIFNRVFRLFKTQKTNIKLHKKYAIHRNHTNENFQKTYCHGFELNLSRPLNILNTHILIFLNENMLPMIPKRVCVRSLLQMEEELLL